jgi:hypothetical protein
MFFVLVVFMMVSLSQTHMKDIRVNPPVGVGLCCNERAQTERSGSKERGLPDVTTGLQPLPR